MWIHSIHDRRERKTKEKRLLRECPEHYNALHQGSEFQLAAGEVIKYEGYAEHDHIRIGDHGNFLARRKRTGCFSFLPGGPRTLFFYELDYFVGVVTCIPLDDDPVDEGYSLLCFCLGWDKRRSGINLRPSCLRSISFPKEKDKRMRPWNRRGEAPVQDLLLSFSRCSSQSRRIQGWASERLRSSALVHLCHGDLYLYGPLERVTAWR